MNKITAYARLLRILGLGALEIPPVIGALTVGVMNRDVIRKYIGIQSFLRLLTRANYTNTYNRDCPISNPNFLPDRMVHYFRTFNRRKTL
jgi:hypothetical protein